MENAIPSQNHPKLWPPERGWPLFLAWMAGIIALQILNGVASAALPITTSPSAIDWKMRVPTVLIAVAMHAWHAWLLFRKHPPRFAMWTALPVIGIFIPFTSKFIQYMSLVAPLLEAALLQGVRRRAWAWILASMAGVVLTQFFFWLMYQAGGSGMIQRLLEGTLGNTSPKAALALATSGVFRGIWIVSEAISAAVLAWKMPPITSPNADPKGYTVS